MLLIIYSLSGDLPAKARFTDQYGTFKDVLLIAIE